LNNFYFSKNRFQRRTGLCVLYFLQGVPQGLIYFALIDWLVSLGLSIKDIAIITAIASIPWSLKFLIGPFIDTFSKSEMGKRRPWIIFSIFALSFVFLVSSITISENTLPVYIGLSFFVAILFTSILDIATDGLAIDTLEEKERGLVNGMMWASRTLGVSLSAIFSAYCLGQYGLNQTMIFIGLIILTLSIFPILQLENPEDKVLSFRNLSYQNNKIRVSIFELIIKMKDAVLSKPIIFILVFCLTANLASGIHYTSISNLYINLTDWEHSDLTKIRSYGLFGGVVAALLGGILSDKHTPYPIIITSQLVISVLALSVIFFVELISINIVGILLLLAFSFFGSFGMTAALSLCMQFSLPTASATMFAVFMSARHFSRIIGESIAGTMDSFGLDIKDIYLVMAILSILPLLFLIRVKKLT